MHLRIRASWMLNCKKKPKYRGILRFQMRSLYNLTFSSFILHGQQIYALLLWGYWKIIFFIEQHFMNCAAPSMKPINFHHKFDDLNRTL